MKLRTIVFAVLASMICISATAQDVKVEYRSNMDSLSNLMKQYFKMTGVESFHLTLKGSFHKKRAKLYKVTCEKGVFSERSLLPDYVHFVLTDSIETLDFTKVPLGKDSIRIGCFYPAKKDVMLFEDTLRMDKMKILLETYASGELQETPLMAYSTGIPIQGVGTYYCGLRSSGVEPRLWYEKYGIDGYTFYVMKLEEDTKRDKNAPIYIKIKK